MKKPENIIDDVGNEFQGVHGNETPKLERVSF
jgi:hypothetical protein